MFPPAFYISQAYRPASFSPGEAFFLIHRAVVQYRTSYREIATARWASQ